MMSTSIMVEVPVIESVYCGWIVMTGYQPFKDL